MEEGGTVAAENRAAAVAT
jgi:hypothetical protein